MNTRHSTWHPAPGVAAAVVMGLLASGLALLPAQAANASTTSALLAWGSNDHAQLGRCASADTGHYPRCVDPGFSATPFEVAGIGDVTQLSAGLGHTLARRADGSVWAWGRNIENELGDSQGAYYLDNGVSTTNEQYCSDCHPNPDRPEPGLVFEYTDELEQEQEYLYPRWKQTYAPLTGVTAVAAGGYHSLALKGDGTVWAWGESANGQLGTGPSPGYPALNYDGSDRSVPGAGKVQGLPTKITAVAAGRNHSLALDENGLLWAWGDNRFGQLGTPRVGGWANVNGGSNLPTRVPLAAPVVDIAAGSDHSLALTADGQVWSWGNNCSAQLGSSPGAEITAFRSVPVPVIGLPIGQVVGVAAGGPTAGGHSLAVTDAGEVWAWGLADVLGTGSASGGVASPCKDDPLFTAPPIIGAGDEYGYQVLQQGRLTPTRVLDSATGQPLSDVEALDAGVFHTLAVQSDGEVFAWGRNDVGQLGPLAPLGQTAPAAIKPVNGTVTAVGAGSHSLVLPGGSDPVITLPPTTTTSTLPPPPPDEWHPAAPMNVARHSLATAVDANGRIYALGGDDGAGNALNSVEVLDPCGAKRWSPIASMPTARKDLAAATGPDGRIYAIGGYETDGTPLATVEAYDPATNTWSTLAGLSVPRAKMGATTGPDGLIYAVGGMTGVEQQANPTYLIGGYGSHMAEAYDTAANFWQPVTPMSWPQVDPEVVTGPDGRIYALSRDDASEGAGWDEKTGVFGNAESYSPGPDGSPGTWRRENAPYIDASTQWLGAATTGPDGRIHTMGGRGGPGSLRSVRRYDPFIKAWTLQVEALTSRRWLNAAASGKDGRIYAIGGRDLQYNPTPSDVTLASTESQQVAPSQCPPGRPPADFDGDAKTDVSVYRPSNGTWYLQQSTEGFRTTVWGDQAQGDVPVAADYDGDGRVDIAVYRPSNGTWYLSQSTDGFRAIAWGDDALGDVPVPGDYDGDSKADIAVYRQATGTWYLSQSSEGFRASVWGDQGEGDVPVPGDYDGDGRSDIAVFRPTNGTWYLSQSTAGFAATLWGEAGDVPVPGDYDGDHSIDIAVFRPSSGMWFLRHSLDGGFEAFDFGAGSDVPVPGDYNADGIADPALYRNGQWFIETGETYSWGDANDVPLSLPYAIRRAITP